MHNTYSIILRARNSLSLYAGKIFNAYSEDNFNC